MIVVTRLNGTRFAVNPDLIERIHESPDTHLVTLDGAAYVVLESLAEVVELIADYRAYILSKARDFPAITGYPAEPGPQPKTRTTTPTTTTPAPRARTTQKVTMDPATVIGLLLAFGSVIVMVTMEGGSVTSLLLPGPLVLAFGATLAIGMAGNTLKDVIQAFKAVPRMFVGKTPQNRRKASTKWSGSRKRRAARACCP